jgi:hypothetical protein
MLVRKQALGRGKRHYRIKQLNNTQNLEKAVSSLVARHESMFVHPIHKVFTPNCTVFISSVRFAQQKYDDDAYLWDFQT